MKFLILINLFTFSLYAFNPTEKFGECDPVYMTPKHTRFILFHSPTGEVELKYKYSDIPEFSIDLYDNEKLSGKPVITLKKDGIWKNGKKICDGTSEADVRYREYRPIADEALDDTNRPFCNIDSLKLYAGYQYDVLGIRAVKLNDKVAEIYHKVNEKHQNYYFDYTKTKFKTILPPIFEHLEQLGVDYKKLSKDLKYIFKDNNLINVSKRSLELNYSPNLFGIRPHLFKKKNLLFKQIKFKYEGATSSRFRLSKSDSTEYNYSKNDRINEMLFEKIKKTIMLEGMVLNSSILLNNGWGFTLHHCNDVYLNRGDFYFLFEKNDSSYELRQFID